MTAIATATITYDYIWLMAISMTMSISSKWFEPRSISSSCSVIVRVSVVLKRTVGDSD